MKGMITVKDIAKILVAKHKLANAEAEIFMQMIVEVVHEGLLRDRQVKIKGFGTFKLQAMKERSSVNVNTGEKVVIGEHDKITFTPDNVMKDLINKPFAQFETVLIDEDSPLLDSSCQLDADMEEEELDSITEENDTVETCVIGIPQTDTVTDQQQGADILPVEEKEEKIEETEEEKQHKVEETQDKEKLPTDDTIETENVRQMVESECEQQYPHCHNLFIYYAILINVVVAASAFTLGYMASSRQWFVKEPSVAVQHKPVIKKTTPSKPVRLEQTDSVSPKDHNNVRAAKDTVAPTAEKVKPAVKEEMTSQYNDDVRIRTGAYNIIGVEKEVVVKQGQTLHSISRTYLGEGMECYVEALNGRREVKAGETIKIPKLKLKKRKR